ncbi:TetR/AcrR family transcriptional regulator [Pantoea agglomerans]|nr:MULTISPECIES: TetR/AcrR family transcriptional regulator [Pantoea]UIL51477.1 TetR/AcrR family transcriptional regulator [Pantoea agglomerans]
MPNRDWPPPQSASVGLTRGALYHHFGDKKGLLAAVVSQVDSEIALRAREVAASADSDWEKLMWEGAAYIEMALDPEVQRIVLLDGPAFPGDPSRWPSQNACLDATRSALAEMAASGALRPVDTEAAARLLNGSAFNAALWVAASENPAITLPKAIEGFRLLASGLLSTSNRLLCVTFSLAYCYHRVTRKRLRHQTRR